MKVYAFLYNFCTNESCAATISIHFSLAGAYKAMRMHRVARYNEWRNERLRYGKGYRSNSHEGWDEWWGIRPIEVLP